MDMQYDYLLRVIRNVSGLLAQNSPDRLHSESPHSFVLRAFSGAQIRMLYTVAVAQLVEHRVVVARVAGSNPVSHPTQLSKWAWPAGLVT